MWVLCVLNIILVVGILSLFVFKYPKNLMKYILLLICFFILVIDGWALMAYVLASIFHYVMGK